MKTSNNPAVKPPAVNNLAAVSRVVVFGASAEGLQAQQKAQAILAGSRAFGSEKFRDDVCLVMARRQ